uniref:Uncharacterized protein n=1 Tax=Rhizophora mucronata TaxID=61149 RepID=A0A2P2QFJ8_RHIMU
MLNSKTPKATTINKLITETSCQRATHPYMHRYTSIHPSIQTHTRRGKETKRGGTCGP